MKELTKEQACYILIRRAVLAILAAFDAYFDVAPAKQQTRPHP